MTADRRNGVSRRRPVFCLGNSRGRSMKKTFIPIRHCGGSGGRLRFGPWIRNLFFVLVFLPAAFPAFGGDQDLQLGLVYLEKAAELYRSGRTGEAAALVETAGQFMTPNSDMDYLKARLLEEEPEGSGPFPEDLSYQSYQRSRLVMALYRQALDKNDWRYFSSGETLAPLAELLFREKAYREAADTLALGDPFDRPTARMIWLEAFSLAELGEIPRAVELLKEGRLFYPGDPELLGLLFRLSPAERERCAGLLLGEAIPDPAVRDGMILALLPRLEEGENPRPLLALYEKYGLYSLPCEIIRIRYGGLDPNPGVFLPVLEKLADSGLFEDGLLSRELYQSLPFDAQKGSLGDLFSVFSGVQKSDENGDGVAELRVSLENGRPAAVEWDPLQNRRASYRCLYENGRAVSFQSQGDPSFFVDYEIYPWVKRLSVHENDRILVYDFLPGNFSFPLELWGSPFGVFEPSPAELPGELSGIARRVGTYVPGAVSPLEEYVPLNRRDGLVYHYPRQEGDYSRRFYVRSDTVVQEALEILDRGYWDTVLYFDEGMLRLLTHDAGDDNYYEYREEDRDGGFSIAWDLNQNGFFECRQTVKNGFLLREYSSRDDGIYDVLVEIEGIF